MRILVLTHLYPPHYVGGNERRCRDITEAIKARGHAVHVLGTTTGGSAELFQQGVNALTYQPGDPIQLAENIVRVAANPRLREDIAHRGQQLVQSQFHLSAIGSHIETYLKETLHVWQPSQLPHYLAA